MPTYKTLAIVDDVNFCDCCGKSNLKMTVAMERDDGQILHFGTVCASKHSGRPGKTIRQEASSALEERMSEGKSKVRAHPTYDQYQAKLAEARALGLIGKPFAQFCEIECAAQRAVQAEIAAALGLRSFEIEP